MSVINKDFTYIDLFAGIGGFRQAMIKYSDGEANCLYSSEINEQAVNTYKVNYNEVPLGDIKKIDPLKMNLDSPDVVCGGFPCQTFSKGGNQAGFKDSRGTLFREIIRIINCYDFKSKPKILILENVQNLVNHDNGETRKTIRHEITESGYNVIERPLIVAPKDFGIPQLRNRAIILAVRKDIYNGKISFDIPRQRAGNCSITSILESESKETNKYKLNKNLLKILDCWDEFIHIIPKDKRIIGYPIWSDEFGQTYDYSDFPKWKQEIIRKNRKLFMTYKNEITKRLKKWKIRDTFTNTDRKFEWQAGKDIDSVYEGIIQFRTSGIRVKRPTESPALVAMDHRPIYGPQKRYITAREAARLQSFPDNFVLNKDPKESFKQLGNAVNVNVIYNVFKLFIEYLDSKEVNNE